MDILSVGKCVLFLGLSDDDLIHAEHCIDRSPDLMGHIGKESSLCVARLSRNFKLCLDLPVFLDLCDITVHVAEHDKQGMIDIPDLIPHLRLDLRHLLQERFLFFISRIGIRTHERGDLSHRVHGISIYRIIGQHDDRNDHHGHHHTELHTECIVRISAGYACTRHDLSGLGIGFIDGDELRKAAKSAILSRCCIRLHTLTLADGLPRIRIGHRLWRDRTE